MSAEEVFIGLGSNIGDSSTIVEQAMIALGNISHCNLRASSSLYRSEAIGDVPQDDYINAVVLLDTSLEPLELLLEMQAIDQAIRHQQQLVIRNQLAFLLQRQLAGEFDVFFHQLHQVVKPEAQQLANFLEPIEGAEATGEQALDAGFGQLERPGNLSISDALTAQLALERVDQLAGLRHSIIL